MERLELTYLKGRYSMTVKVTDPVLGPELWNSKGELLSYLVSGEGLSIRYTGSGAAAVGDPPDYATYAHFEGEFNYTGERPDSLTFTHYRYDHQGQPVMEEKGIFTVPIK